MVIREQLQKTISHLRENNCENAVFEAHCLVRHVLCMDATDLVINHEKVVTGQQTGEIKKLTDRRILGEPLQYILGTQEFMSLEFTVNKDVLIPRADTETLVEYLIDAYKGKGYMLLDICTGTGCIAISAAHYNKRVYARGIDVSEKALSVARSNCKTHMLEDRVSFEQLDILKEIPKGKYDVAVSNPPYIESEVIDTLDKNVRDFEPWIALDGGADGLDFYRRIVDIAPCFLNKNGQLIFEIGSNQGESVKRLMQPKFKELKIIKDLCGNDRVVSGILI